MFKVTQSFVTAKDDGIAVLSTVDPTFDKSYLILIHEPYAINEAIYVYVDGVVVDMGFPGSNAEFEMKRVSTTQTIIKKTTTGSVSITVDGPVIIGLNGQEPIGRASIGTTFIIG